MIAHKKTPPESLSVISQIDKYTTVFDGVQMLLINPLIYDNDPNTWKSC